LRTALLDGWPIVAAGLAVCAALVARGLDEGLSVWSVGSLGRIVLELVTLTLILTAAVESRGGLPLAIVLFGAAQACFLGGDLVHGFSAVEASPDDVAWPYAGWLPGLALSLLAGGTVIVGANPTVSPFGASAIPEHPAGARIILYASLGALGVAVGVAFYGHAVGEDGVLVAGLVAAISIGAAAALRASSSIREVERAYDRLDRALAAEERLRDELTRANEELARVNVESRYVHTAFGDLLSLADERAHGGLRELIEESGEELARLLRSYVRRS
jgi:hypothetical protein